MPPATIAELQSSEIRLRSIQIRCEAPWAGSVAVAGTFNQWNTLANPLKKDKKGAWTTTLKLPPGRYEHKFFIDGRWCCYPGCCDEPFPKCPENECVPNEFGTANRVLTVS